MQRDGRLLPLIPEFEALTGIKVEYLILPENEYFAKLVADLSNQRGEFTVIMTGPMRNWTYAPPGWILPLDQFLNDPKLTDKSWYKPEDFFPGLIAANRWSGKIGGGTGEGSLWSIPIMCESYILVYRKDIFDKYKIKVPTTYEEMAEAARLVKKNAGIDGIMARGTPNTPTIATGYISGAKPYTDGKWAEADQDVIARLSDPRHVKFSKTVGLPCFGFYEGRDRPCEPCPTIRAFETGIVQEIERYNALGRRWYRIVSQPVRDMDGRVAQVLEGITDITDRKQAEEALRLSQEKYRELVENANSIIFRSDREGNITFFNDYAQRFCGFSAGEVLGRNVIGTIVPESDSAGRDHVAMIQEISEHPDGYKNNENENIKKSGERVWISWTNRAIYNEKGEFVELLSVGNDITASGRTC